MKLLFICSSLEPGRDGVGDYTRRLAAALITRGVECQIVALHDRAASGNLPEEPTAQDCDAQEVTAWRFPATASWTERMRRLQGILDDFRPDWVSLQFVPYGFHDKGIPWFLPGRLASLRGNFRWHIMFHELWIGENLGSPLKHRIYRVIQTRIVKRLCDRIRAERCLTSTPVYQKMLGKLGVNAGLTPIFSNIPNRPGQLSLRSELTKWRENRHSFTIGLLFGGVNLGWSAAHLVLSVAEVARKTGRRLVVLSVGRDGMSTADWERFRATNFLGLEVVRMGAVSTEEASALINWSDFGFLTTPLELVGKSGVAAAFISHGLPILINRDDWVTSFGSSAAIFPPLVDCRDNKLNDISCCTNRCRPREILAEAANQYKDALF